MIASDLQPSVTTDGFTVSSDGAGTSVYAFSESPMDCLDRRARQLTALAEMMCGHAECPLENLSPSGLANTAWLVHDLATQLSG